MLVLLFDFRGWHSSIVFVTVSELQSFFDHSGSEVKTIVTINLRQPPLGFSRLHADLSDLSFTTITFVICGVLIKNIK